MKRRLFQWPGLAAVPVLWILQGCTPAPEAVKPVALQNQQNLAALAENVRVVLSLYEPLLRASSNALIYQHIGKTHQELIAVVGASVAPPPPETTWDALFEKSASSFMGKKEKYHERYQLARSALARGGPDLERLRGSEGWIFTAAAMPQSFTPQEAHALIKTLTDLRRSTPDPTQYFQSAETRLLPYDGTLAKYRQASDGAGQLLEALKQEINSQINTAFVHSQALANYAVSSIDVNQTISGTLNSRQVNGVLQNLGNKYIPDPNKRNAALDLLNTGINAVTAAGH